MCTVESSLCPGPLAAGGDSDTHPTELSLADAILETNQCGVRRVHCAPSGRKDLQFDAFEESVGQKAVGYKDRVARRSGDAGRAR